MAARYSSGTLLVVLGQILLADAEISFRMVNFRDARPVETPPVVVVVQTS